LVGRVDHTADKDFVKECLRTPLTEVFGHGESLSAVHEVFRKEDSCCSLSLKRDCIAGLITSLSFLIVVCVDPNIGDVVIEDFTHFVDYSRRQLGRNFS